MNGVKCCCSGTSTGRGATVGGVGTLNYGSTILHSRTKSVTTQEASPGGIPPEEGGDWIWRCRLPEGYPVLTGGTKGLPRKTRRKASKALSPFLRAVET